MNNWILKLRIQPSLHTFHLDNNMSKATCGWEFESPTRALVDGQHVIQAEAVGDVIGTG